MMRRLVYSPAAKDDLDGILSYIASDKPGAATRFAARLKKQCKLLIKNPFIGEDCSLLRPRMRRITVTGYLIFFRVDERVEVTRVIHGARDWKSLFE
jgi:toxin ParE1/3/4